MRPGGTDVLVVGAGPAGLSLALQASEHGASVRIVERREERFRPSRALIVHARTLEVLRPLGVTEALLERSEVAPSVCLHLGRREVPARLGPFAIADTPYPNLLFVAQAVVEAVLEAALAARGVEVERGCELTQLTTGRDGAAVALSGQGRERWLDCQFVAGCDGPASTVRRLVGLRWRGGPYRQEAVLADVELEDGLAPGTAHAVAAAAGVLFVFCLRERATWRLLATRAATDGGPPGQPQEPVPVGELQQLLDGAGLAAHIAEVAWSARVPLQHRLASHYREGPVFLVGDAAHVHSPAGGQGMNTGIQDATNLGWKLAFAARSPAGRDVLERRLLDSYEAERRPIARRALALTHALFWAEAGSGAVPTFVRRDLVPLGAPLVPLLLGRRRLVAGGVRVLSQLGLRYRHSPLSMESRPALRRGARPGARLADGAVSTMGRVCRLHELLARPGVHVLLERDAAGHGAGAHDPVVLVHRIASWPGRGVLAVRPDGYVGLRSASSDGPELGRWLELVGLGGRLRPSGDGLTPGRATTG